jgi:hypothetical protein
MLEIESDNPGGDLEVSLSGLGITPAPEIAVDPAQVEFGERKAGTVSTGETIAIGNDGFADLHVSGIAVAGAGAAEFELTPASCATATIAPGAECEFQVAFGPDSPGAKEAEVVIASDDAGGPIEVAVEGVGTEPEIVADPVAFAFADQEASTESAFEPVEIWNHGEAELGIGLVSKSGEDQIDFSVYAAECAASPLPPGESCTLWVSFRPTGVGERSAAIEIASDSPAGTLIVPLSGTATGEGPQPGPKPQHPADQAPQPAGESIPNTRFTRKPRARIAVTGAGLAQLEVGFASSRPGSTFQCSLDGRLFRICASPLTLRNLASGQHRLRVRAIGPTGLIGPVATANFKVVRRN